MPPMAPRRIPQQKPLAREPPALEVEIDPVDLRSRKALAWLARSTAVGLVYLLLLAPSQQMLALLPGTEVRPAAFLPVVAGIAIGTPAAFGVFWANLLADTVTGAGLAPVVVAGSALNAMLCLLANRLWWTTAERINVRGVYLYDVRSLAKYLVIVVVLALIAACGVSLLLSVYAGTELGDSWATLLLNNLEFGVALGIPALIALPLLDRLCVQPGVSARQGPSGRWSLAPLAAPLLAWLIIAAMKDPSPSTTFAATITALGLLVIPASRPVRIVPTANSHDQLLLISMKTQLFNRFVLLVMSLTLTFGVLIALVLRQYDPSSLSVWSSTYRVTSLAMYVVLFGSALLLWWVERRVTGPLLAMAESATKQAAGGNELDILRANLDFVVTQADGSLLATQHTLYIGLNDRDTYTQLVSTEAARATLGEICLRFVDGYLASESTGGWRDDTDQVTHEQTLVFTIFGASDTQIRQIADEALVALNQNAILIDTDGRRKELYTGRR